MNREQLMQVLIAPYVTEKATTIAESGNEVVFEVARDAAKPVIKKAVETMFDVKVASVRTCILKGKTKKFRGQTGKRSSLKKAYVRLKPGYEIDFMEVE